jgi:hypothetical protein
MPCGSTQVPHEPYLLGPLSGIRVSITNFGARERDGVAKQLRSGGADYTAELYKTMTHLVSNRVGGNKYT